MNKSCSELQALKSVVYVTNFTGIITRISVKCEKVFSCTDRLDIHSHIKKEKSVITEKGEEKFASCSAQQSGVDYIRFGETSDVIRISSRLCEPKRIS